MEILGIAISDRAVKQIEELCGAFSRQVRYLPIESRSDGGGEGTAGDDRAAYYTVYLEHDPDRHMFEANILHELYHIRQFEAGFPALCNKSSQLYISDSDIVEQIGGSIFSCVLDLEVYERLRECRYSDSVFADADQLYDSLLKAAEVERSDPDDKYDFAYLVTIFAKALYLTNPEQDEKLKEQFKNCPRIMERSLGMRDMLRSNHPGTPESAVIAMGSMLDMLELWDLFYIRLADKMIRTKNEFEAYTNK